jgi:hypothetical protein
MMPIYEKETYENGTASMEIIKTGAGKLVWLQAGFAGVQLTMDEFASMWPLIKGYAKELGLDEA